MNPNTKIRWLLLLVTICLFATALTAGWSSNNLVNLISLAEDTKQSLNKKETFIYDYLAEPENIKNLKILENNSDKALKTIESFTSKNISFQTYKQNQLVFWSDAFVSINNLEDLKEGSTFINQNNQYFEVIKRTFGNFTTAFFIPVYKGIFNNNKTTDKNNEAVINTPLLKIASLFDTNVADVTNIEGKFLFSVMINPEINQMPHSNLEILLWFSGLITLLILINSYLRVIALIGHPILAVFLLICFFIVLRGFNLNFSFPEAIYNLKLFDSEIYYFNELFPSLADVFLNVFSALWIVVFFNSVKEKALKPIKKEWLGYLVLALSFIAFTLLSNIFSDLFKSLVYNSNINFNVSNLFNLNWLSILGIVILLMGFLIYYILLRILFSLSKQVLISINHKFIALLIAFTLYALFLIATSTFTIYPFIVLTIILIKGYHIYLKKTKLSFPLIVVITFLFATICTLKLNDYRNIKELEVRKTLILKLVKKSDLDAISSLLMADSIIKKDTFFNQVFLKTALDKTALQAYLYQKYFNNFKIRYALYDTNEAIINSNFSDVRSLSFYQDFLTENGTKLNNLFYKTSDNSNTENFHAVIEIKDKGKPLGKCYINLNTLQINGAEKYASFEDYSKDIESDIYSDYSYAFYRNNKLLSQKGPFIYKIANTEYLVGIKQFLDLKKGEYEHLIYKPNFNNTIVISYKTPSFWRQLAALSFFFIIFLLVAVIIYFYRWIFTTAYISSFNLKNFQKLLLTFNNKILYRTRIQIALVLAVVSSLFIIGIITFSYISVQYKDQQKEFLANRIEVITKSFQDNLAGANQAKNLDNSSLTFQDFSKLYGADINLFNIKGKLISTTKSNLFEDGLLAQRMNPIAFVKLNIDKYSEYIQEEKLASLDYTSAYMPIRNIDNIVVGYLQVPYFANQEDYNQKIGSFLNLLINIYVLVFVAVGFFAFVIANQITGPLSLIQESISTTMIGRKNKPIAWKRNDEIGSLVIEYNNMIAKLEDNANKLAQSERETAWREMAKQVAHEIKNPLTPLRLGIQMLDRSWREKDPKFDDKFTKFSASFIEQIDSLSRIASEFSNFAKMPQLKLEHLDVVTVLNKSIDVYSQMENIKIVFKYNMLKSWDILADKDQLLRSFNNVLKNAIEAISPGKQGIIDINCITINDNVQISVSDNGAGIPLNLRENIFVPNFTTKSSGTGLGLAFVKQAIENMKGNIYFTTEIDVGTTFYITLPLV